MLNNSKIHNHAYDIIHMNKQRNSWLFNRVVIQEYAKSILGRTLV